MRVPDRPALALSNAHAIRESKRKAKHQLIPAVRVRAVDVNVLYCTADVEGRAAELM